MLVALAEHETQRKVTERVMDNLPPTLQEEPEPQTKQLRTAEIARLVREL